VRGIDDWRESQDDKNVYWLRYPFRLEAVEFAIQQVGRPYSLLAVIKAFVRGEANNELGYCSGLVRRSLMAMGWQGGGIADLPCDVAGYSCVSKEGVVLK
jgi:hypothetical protein